MKGLILRDPTFSLGLVVWIVAASVFPLQLGLAGATAGAFVGYVVLAGGLLSMADPLLHSNLNQRWSDVALQAVFWVIGLAVPAAVAFAIGSAFAPARDGFPDDLCRLAGVVAPPDDTEGALAEAFDPTERCEAAA